LLCRHAHCPALTGLLTSLYNWIVKKASRNSWTSRPPPSKWEALEYKAKFSTSEFSKISRGIIPSGIDDKWFVYCENLSVYFHRSQTGHCIYKVDFARTLGGYSARRAWVNAVPSEYKQQDRGYDTRMLHFVIRGVVLGERICFPAAPGMSILVPETPHCQKNKRPWWKFW